MDLSKLTPAPWGIDSQGWRVGAWERVPCKVICDLGTNKASRNPENAANAEFIALARNAFDVMMRRGWTVHADASGESWVDADDVGRGGIDEHDWHAGPFENWLKGRSWPDPFTALVEADRWYTVNVETKDGEP